MQITRKARRIVTCWIAVLLLALVPSIAAAKISKEVDYLALGNSLAAGQTPYKEIGNGYPDYIAEKLDEIDYLQDFTDSFAVPGYTSADVLEDIENNVEIDDVSIQQFIKKAEIITLDAGANDLLKEISITPSGISLDPDKIGETIDDVNSNLKKILRKIKKLNPKAEVYVMGYYNPFPYLPDQLQEQLLPLLDALNGKIKDAAKDEKATFVPTADVFAENFQTFLPNPRDIHPSAEGYQAIADEFWAEIEGEFIVSKLAANERKVTLHEGEEVQISLVASYKSGGDEDVTADASWMSEKESIATVENGLITAIKKGTATIKAKYGGRTASVTVTVE